MKILAFLIAVFFTINLTAFDVSAEYSDFNNDVQTLIKGVHSVLDGAQKYYNGEITAEEFHSHFSDDMGRIGVAGFDIMSCGGYSDFVQFICGSPPLVEMGIRDYFTDYSQHHGGGGGEQGRREFDMHGYGACLYLAPDGGSEYTKYYMDYGELVYYSSGGYYNIKTHGFTYGLRKSYGSSEKEYSGIYSDFTRQYTSSNMILYGDWRYSDGTPSTDYITDNPVIPPSIEDPQDIDLIQFLNDFLTKLNFEYPDLSTLEGLLTSILNKLGSLDSDNDTEILSQIYIAIQSLNNDSHDNSEIISLLQEIRDNISSGGEASDLTELTDELKDITKTLKYIAGIETIDVVTDSIDFSTIEFSPTETKFFDKYGQLINLIITKFGYGPVDVLIKSCQSLIFNTSAPGDLTFTYKGTDYTVLSTTMFEDDSVKQSLSLVKSFLSVIILLSWLFVMRKRIVNSE